MIYLSKILFTVVLFAMLNPGPDHSQNSLRAVTYNIQAGQQEGIEGIAGQIKALDPDIIALQEVDVHWGERSDYRDQLSYLADTLDMHAYYGEIYALPPDQGQEEERKFGLAFLSKHPFLSTQNHQLTRLSTLGGEAAPEKLPGFPEVAVRISGKNITLFNTHLDYRPDPEVRSIQVGEMLQIMGESKGPKLLLGDLNAEPADPELEPLFQRFHDAWQGGSKGYTYPSREPEKRIDYILHSDHLKLKEAFVAETQASDHRPVVADFRLR